LRKDFSKKKTINEKQKDTYGKPNVVSSQLMKKHTFNKVDLKLRSNK